MSVYRYDLKSSFEEAYRSMSSSRRRNTSSVMRGACDAMTRCGRVEDGEILTAIPFERDLEETKKRFMVPLSTSANVSLREILMAVRALDGWNGFAFGLNLTCVSFWVLSMSLVSVSLPRIAMMFLNIAAAVHLAVRAVRERRRDGEPCRLTPAVKGYLKTHREKEKALRQKVDGFNRALEARRESERLLGGIEKELRASSDEAWRKRKAELRGDVDAYLAGMCRAHQEEFVRNRFREKVETYRRLEAAMRHYPDSGGYDRTVDLSVYQEVAQAFHELEEEAERLGIPFDESIVRAAPLLTAGKKIE